MDDFKEFKKILDEIAGSRILKEVLKGCNEKEAKILNAFVIILQKHGMTKMDAINICLELVVFLKNDEVEE